MSLIAERAFNPGLSQLSQERLSHQGDRTGLCSSQHPGASVPARSTPSRSVSAHSRALIPFAAGSLPPLHAQDLPCGSMEANGPAERLPAGGGGM